MQHKIAPELRTDAFSQLNVRNLKYFEYPTHVELPNKYLMQQSTTRLQKKTLFKLMHISFYLSC